MNSHLVSLSLIGDLWYYISLPLVHPLLTFVSHPCPYLSAHPIGHFLWCSVSCCGPDSAVQRSCTHKWGQGVSCGYLIRRWQLLLELLFYHAPMAGPLGLELPLGCSRRLPLAAWRFPLPWFGLSRAGSSSAVYLSNLDSFCSYSDISSFSAWAMGPIWNGSGPYILWPYNSPSKSCYPTPRAGRRILMLLGLY